MSTPFLTPNAASCLNVLCEAKTRVQARPRSEGKLFAAVGLFQNTTVQFECKNSISNQNSGIACRLLNQHQLSEPQHPAGSSAVAVAWRASQRGRLRQGIQSERKSILFKKRPYILSGLLSLPMLFSIEWNAECLQSTAAFSLTFLNVQVFSSRLLLVEEIQCPPCVATASETQRPYLVSSCCKLFYVASTSLVAPQSSQIRARECQELENTFVLTETLSFEQVLFFGSNESVYVDVHFWLFCASTLGSLFVDTRARNGKTTSLGPNRGICFGGFSGTWCDLVLSAETTAPSGVSFLSNSTVFEFHFVRTRKLLEPLFDSLKGFC